MTYASLCVALDLGPNTIPRVKLAADLADRFGARLIGVAGREPVISVVGAAPFADAVIFQQDGEFASEELQEVENAFRVAAGGRGTVEVRTAISRPDLYLAEQARAADLVIVGRQGRRDPVDSRFGVDPGDIILAAGRPVLITPPEATYLSVKRILVAWKETREARRAVRDALPLLRAAEEVVVAAVGETASDAAATDVARFLELHGVVAQTRLQRLRERTVADELVRLAEEDRADLIVAGAYGHSRTREWILGGVTRDLLDRCPVCCLMAH
jgi:nucleotide-binding universal stress UspA family protein